MIPPTTALQVRQRRRSLSFPYEQDERSFPHPAPPRQRAFPSRLSERHHHS